VSAASPLQESLEPATGRPLGSVAVTAPEDVGAVVAGVAAVQPLWAQLRLTDRARYMRRAAQAIIDEHDELVRLIAREQGRPVAEAAHMEVLPAIETLLWLAEEGPGVLGPHRVGLSHTFFLRKRAQVTAVPLGVIAVVSPPPSRSPSRSATSRSRCWPATASCSSPRPFACLCGERIGRLFARAGLPEGLLRIVHGGSATGRALVGDPACSRSG
jgi:acyl-CoA reductase-like NAD-dependent aldehyde dehydrogenase